MIYTALGDMMKTDIHALKKSKQKPATAQDITEFVVNTLSAFKAFRNHCPRCTFINRCDG